MAEKTRKALYHSELSKMGVVQVDVISDVLESKHKKGTFYVKFMHDGLERDYYIDSEAVKYQL